MRIGIIGGGQLARMLILAGSPLGIDFLVYTPAPHSSTHAITKSILGDFKDTQAIDTFIQKTDVITYENENIPIDFIHYIHSKKTLHPGIKAIQNAQDRVYEKRLFTTLDIPTNRYHPIDNANDLHAASQQLGLPFIIKSRRNGYDGKHQHVIRTESDITHFNAQPFTPSIAEELINFEREVSLIAARDKQGSIAFYDLCQNQHQQGILYKTLQQPKDSLFLQAKTYVTRLMEHLNYVGILTLEFFVKDQQLIANEIAPRVHNSGHWTIEGAVTSQFENHIRAICGFPLGSTDAIGHSALLNCITQMPNIQKVLHTTKAHYHDYCKAPKSKRKLGHITIMESQRNVLEQKITTLEKILHPVSENNHVMD